MLSKADLTQGSITGTLLRFTLPMIIGSLLQQCYNIADTLIVGQCIGSGALAAVGSAYTLMVFLISILLGLSMGSGTVFSLQYLSFIHPILKLLQIPDDIYQMMYDYLWIIFWGIGFTFIYNFYAALLRAIGNAVTPLYFLAISVVLNIGLDLFFILLLEIPRTEITPQRPAFRPPLPERNHFVLHPDLYTTIGNEFGNSNGTRTGQ